MVESRDGNHRNRLPNLSLIMAELVAPLDSLDASGGRPIWGEIWIKAGEVEFPDAEWSDLIVALSADFLHATIELERGKSKTVFVRFFDGPFEVELTCHAPTVWSLRGSKKGRSIFSFNIDPLKWSESVRSVAERLAGLDSLRSSSDGDLQRLRMLLSM